MQIERKLHKIQTIKSVHGVYKSFKKYIRIYNYYKILNLSIFLTILQLLVCEVSAKRQAKEIVNLKKLQQALNYDPDILEKINKVNLASAFDNDIGVKIKKKGHTDSSDVYNDVETNNEINVYQEKIKLKTPVKKEEILIKNEFDPGYLQKKLFWRKLNIPEGSSLSLAIQVSRPDILPGIFFQGDGIVLDAVIELPLWFDLDVYAKHVYENMKPKPTTAALVPVVPAVAVPAAAVPAPAPAGGGGGERSAGDSSEDDKILGYERCYLYDQIEAFTARTMEITQSQAHLCILRTICELHSLVAFRPEFANASVLFELVLKKFAFLLKSEFRHGC